MTLLELFPTSTRTEIISSYSGVLISFFIICLDNLDSFDFFISVIFRMSEVTCCRSGASIEGCLSRLSIFRKKSFFEIHFFYCFSWLCCEKSFCDTKSDGLYKGHELVVCLFLVDDERIFLGISFKCDFFTKMSHTIDMSHPELIDGRKSKSSFEFSKFLFCTGISKAFDLSREE